MEPVGQSARNDEKIKKTVEKLNKMCGGKTRRWFVCGECNELKMGQGVVCWFSKGGDEQALLCHDCTTECDECGERYGSYRGHCHQHGCPWREEKWEEEMRQFRQSNNNNNEKKDVC